MLRDYRRWHDAYDDPGSALAQRLKVVQARLHDCLSAATPGPIRLISMCAGQGRDVLGVLPTHPRRDDVSATLIELDHDNVDVARRSAEAARLSNVEVIEGDAAVSDVYRPFVPADILLACGIFGNISTSDLEHTVRHLSMLCRDGAALIWTRHRLDPDLTPAIRRWLTESGFEEASFDAVEHENRPGIGTARLAGDPLPFLPGFRFFTFVR